jgi:hypothetical protein
MSTAVGTSNRTSSIQRRLWSGLRKHLTTPAGNGSARRTGKERSTAFGEAVAARVFKDMRRILPDRLLLHRKQVGRFPNLRHPATFNEIVLDRCLNPDLF